LAGPLRYSAEPGGSELAALRHAKPLNPAQPALLGAIKGEIQGLAAKGRFQKLPGSGLLLLTLLNHQPLSM
jgi:hypothetical protein